MLALKSVERVMRNAGAKRVSRRAVELVVEFIEDYVKRICEESNLYARHAERKTVLAKDIRIAEKRIRI